MLLHGYHILIPPLFQPMYPVHLARTTRVESSHPALFQLLPSGRIQTRSGIVECVKTEKAAQKKKLKLYYIVMPADSCAIRLLTAGV